MFKKISIAVVIISIFFILIGTNGKIIGESTSDNNKNKIMVEGKPATLFGPSRVKVKGKMGWKSKTYKTEIMNDGKNLSENNVEIKWSDEMNAVVTLKGEEQRNEEIKISFEDGIEIK